ncbi:MAG: response regulator [Desulfobulbaceae bacterium]|nr:response regulator [Desulfobulbaceae bacterium]
MIRIAIVDDSGCARMFIQKCLEIIGLKDATFIEAANGKEALEKMKETPVDLLITDLSMPVMDGEALLKWVKGSPELKELPVLVISSAGNPAREEKLLALGAMAVLAKPISPVTLLHTLEPFLDAKEENNA